jgi:2-polyprenyl-3-methyl-5-hydroxy-6-metoxy-1,4-benzoquinol methylase
VPLSKYDIEAGQVREPGTSHNFMVELIGSNKRVLDVGCDTGYLGTVLSALGGTVCGFEVDPVTAAEAANHLARVEVGDLERTDLVELFGAGNFDVVVFGDVLEHLRDPLPILRQARPLLAPGGSVIISTPNIAHGDIRLALLQGRFRYTQVGILDETHTKFFTKDSLVSFLSDAGFILTDLRRTQAPLFTTETGVKEEDFDPSLVETLRADPEATTYQFVLRAVPEDSATAELAVALQVDELTTQLRLQQEDSQYLRNERKRDSLKISALEDLVEQRDLRLTEVMAAHDEAVKGRDGALAQMQGLHEQTHAAEVRAQEFAAREAEAQAQAHAAREQFAQLHADVEKMNLQNIELHDHNVLLLSELDAIRVRRSELEGEVASLHGRLSEAVAEVSAQVSALSAQVAGFGGGRSLSAARAAAASRLKGK